MFQQSFQNTGHRTTPDVSFDASEFTGVTCFQSGGLTYGNFGTSLSSPCWAGLIAIANQGRVASGSPTLNSVANPCKHSTPCTACPPAIFVTSRAAITA